MSALVYVQQSSYMYVCVFVCEIAVSVCTFICMCECVCVCVCVMLLLCVYVHACVCMYVCLCMHFADSGLKLQIKHIVDVLFIRVTTVLCLQA